MPMVQMERTHGAEHEYLKAWAKFNPSQPPHILSGDEVLLRDSTAYMLMKSKSQCDSAKLPNDDHRFHLGLLPQPFHGRPATARIYILMLNPGFSPNDYAWEYEHEPFRKSLVEQYQGDSPFLFLDPRFTNHPGYGYWYAKRQIAQLTPILAARLRLTHNETLVAMAREFAALQLVPYHSSEFDRKRSLINSLRSVQLVKRFVAEYALPRARAGECVIIAARGNWAWNLQPENNVVVYVNAECRSALLGPATRGGAAILAHYSGQRISPCCPVIPPCETRPRPERVANPLAAVSTSMWDIGNSKHYEDHCTSLRINSQPLGARLHRLSIYYNHQYIGEYERSQAADIDRKKEEIECSLPLLLDVYKRKGEFEVRWDGRHRVKSVRVNGIEVGQIPRECWRKASWQT